MALRSLFLVFLSVAGIGTAWAWTRVFFQQVEPAARRVLGKHWGVIIEWERSEHRTGWEIRGPEKGRAGQVALASVVVWMLGFFTPCLLGIAGVKLGLIPERPGFLLVFLSLLVSLLSFRASVNSRSRV